MYTEYKVHTKLPARAIAMYRIYAVPFRIDCSITLCHSSGEHAQRTLMTLLVNVKTKMSESVSKAVLLAIELMH